MTLSENGIAQACSSGRVIPCSRLKCTTLQQKN